MEGKFNVGDKVIYRREVNTIVHRYPHNSNFGIGVRRDKDGFIDTALLHELTPIEIDTVPERPKLKPGQRVFHAGEKFYVSSMAGENYILVNKNWLYGKEVESHLIVPVDLARDQIASIEKALAELTKLIAKLKQDHAEQESV